MNACKPVSNFSSRSSPSFSGFTLLEVMVAVSIISIVLVSVYKLHSQSIAMSNSVKFYSIAPFLANKKIVGLETEKEMRKEDDSGDFGDNYQGFKWKLSVENVEAEVLGNLGESLVKIDVRIFFNDEEFVYDLRTYRYLY